MPKFQVALSTKRRANIQCEQDREGGRPIVAAAADVEEGEEGRGGSVGVIWILSAAKHECGPTAIRFEDKVGEATIAAHSVFE